MTRAALAVLAFAVALPAAAVEETYATDPVHSQPLTVQSEHCGEHPFNKRPMCGAEATASVKRSDWGMKYGLPKAVADDVRIIIPIEAYRE